MTQNRSFTAFRHHIETTHGLSGSSAVRYVRGAKALHQYCAEHGLDIERGAVPKSLLLNFAEHYDDPRCQRGAALYGEFLRQQGVPLPVFDAILDPDKVERLLEAAATLREPYATLLHMLPMSGLRADTLRKLYIDDVIEDGDALALHHEQEEVWLCERARVRLREYLCRWRAHFDRESDLLFPGRTGNTISASTISRKLRECQHAAELPEFRITALSDLYPYLAAAEPEAGSAGRDGAVHLPAADDDVPHTIASLGGLPPRAPEPPLAIHDRPLTTDEENQPAVSNNHRSNGKKPRGRTANRTSASETGRLRDIVPSRGQVHIRHRRDDGELEYCGVYRYENIACDGSIEPFIFSTLAPRWGGGKYFCYDSAKPSAEPIGSVYIAEPSKQGPETPGAHHGSYHGSSLDELRQTLQVLHEMQVSHGGASPQHQYEHGVRVGRLETLLERMLKQPPDPYGAPGLGHGLGDVPHAPLPYGPIPTTMPMPGPLPPSAPDVAQQMLEMLMQNQRMMNERAEQERRRADEERRYYRDRLERELTQRSDSNANPFAGATEMVKHFQSFAEAAKGLSPNASNDNNKPWLEKLTNTLIERGVDKGLDSVIDAFSNGNVAFGDISKPQSSQPHATAPRDLASAPPAKTKTQASSAPPDRTPKPRANSQATTPPQHVPAYFVEPAQRLDQVARQGTDEQLGEQITTAIGALAMDEQWAPFVQPIGVAIMTNQRDRALRQTAAVLSALVQGQHLQRATAKRVLHLMGNHWEELREQAIASIQLRHDSG